MRPDCHSCPLYANGACANTPNGLVSDLGGCKLPLRCVRAGAQVFNEGDDGTCIHILLQGWAVASTMHVTGRRQVLRFLLPGSLVGFEAASDGTMPCTVEALTELTLCRFPRQKLQRLCESVPAVALKVASLLAAETISDWQLLGSLGTCSAIERIARLLLMLHNRVSSVRGGGDVLLPVSQTVIADATGLTSVHVCRTLKEMRIAGLLTFSKGHLRILNWNRLLDLAGINDLIRVEPHLLGQGSYPPTESSSCVRLVSAH